MKNNSFRKILKNLGIGEMFVGLILHWNKNLSCFHDFPFYSILTIALTSTDNIGDPSKDGSSILSLLVFKSYLASE